MLNGAVNTGSSKTLEEMGAALTDERIADLAVAIGDTLHNRRANLVEGLIAMVAVAATVCEGHKYLIEKFLTAFAAGTGAEIKIKIEEEYND